MLTTCPFCKVRPRRRSGEPCTQCKSERAKATRAKDIEEGKLCSRCKAAPRGNHAYCSACSTEITTAYKQRVIAAGKLCGQCNEKPCNSSGTICGSCQAIQRKQTPEKFALYRARKQAKANGWEFNLTLDDIKIPTHCPVFGIPLVLSDDYVKDDSPSLDRLDSTRGYVRGNVWVISYRANRIKNNATLEELEQLVCVLKEKIL